MLANSDKDIERLRNLDDQEKRALIRILSVIDFFERVKTWFRKEVEVKIDPSYSVEWPHFNIGIVQNNEYTYMNGLDWEDKESIVALLRNEAVEGSVRIERQVSFGLEVLDVPKWARLRLADKIDELSLPAHKVDSR